MLARLGSSLRLLVGGAQDVPARQKTLRNTIDWSYSLLDSDEQVLFARLAVFEGGCTLEAAELICNADGAVDVLSVMESLVDKSLLRQVSQDSEARLLMLQVIREYALERLEQSGEVESIRHAHARYCMELAEAAHGQIRGPQQAEWMARLESEHGNFRSAMTWLLERDNAAALRLGTWLWRFWMVRSHLSEGRTWLERALTTSVEAPSLFWAEALTGLGRMVADQGDYGKAMEILGQALDLWRALGNLEGTAYALSTLALVYQYQGEHEEAVTLLEGSLETYRQTEDKWGTSAVLNLLGTIALSRGEHDRAFLLLEESLLLYRQVGGTREIAVLLNNLGIAAAERQRPTAAMAHLAESLVLSQELEDLEGICSCLEEMAVIAHAADDHARATRLYAASEDLRRGYGGTLHPDEMERFDRLLADLRSAMDNEAFKAAWRAGQAMTQEQAIRYASGDDGHDTGGRQ